MVQCYGFVNRCQRISGTYFAVISRVISLIKIRILIVMANPVTPEKKGKRPTTFKDTYKKDFPCIRESRKGPTHAFCTEMEDVSGVGKRYQFLPAVMQCVMAIYYSNADWECVFSMVNKNKTKERGNMSTSTLNSLMTHKLAMQNRGIKCHSASYSKTLLSAAKSSTYKGLNGQPSKTIK